MPVVSVSSRHFQLTGNNASTANASGQAFPASTVSTSSATALAGAANVAGQAFAGSPAVTGGGGGSPPTLAAAVDVKAEVSANALVSNAFTPSAGEVLVVKAGTWSTATAPGTPSGGGLTWTQRVVEAGGSFNGRFEIWTAVVGTSPGSMTVTMTPAASSHHAMSLERWSGAQLAATPVTGQGFTNNIDPVLATITTTGDSSIVSWGLYDNNSADPTGRAYRSSAVEEFVTAGGSNGVFYFAYQAAAAAGSQDMGLTAPSGVKWNLAGIEIQASSSSASRAVRAQQVIQPRKPHRAWRTTPSQTVVMAPVQS